jgi:SNF2 family DNA or RNA helicase
MGTGKTLLAVELMRQIQETPRYKEVGGEMMELPGRLRALVVAPINTHHSWEATIRRQMPGTAITILGTPGSDEAGWKRLTSTFKMGGVYIIGWEAMHGWVEKVKDPGTGDVISEISHVPPWQLAGTFDLVVADECHRMQNRKSMSAKVLKAINAERRLAMSGTPAGNRKEGIWSTLNWLWPGKYPYFWPWINETMVTRPDPYKKIAIEGEKERGSTIRDIPSYTRLELADVNDQLPPVAEHVVEVDMGPKQSKIYKDFKDQAFAWLEDMPVGTPLPITQRIRLRQVALGTPSAVIVEKTKRKPMEVTKRKLVEVTRDEDDNVLDEKWDDVVETVMTEEIEEKLEVYFKPNSKSSKIEALKEILSDLPDGEPVLVFLHSKRFAEPVAHQLGKRAVIWSGDTSQAKRREIMGKFGKPGGPQIIVAVISAISEGTDGLQRVCANEVWLSQDDNNLMNEQAKARLLRTGQERMVNRWYIQSVGTIDKGVYIRTGENRVEMKDFYRVGTEQ